MLLWTEAGCQECRDGWLPANHVPAAHLPEMSARRPAGLDMMEQLDSTQRQYQYLPGQPPPPAAAQHTRQLSAAALTIQLVHDGVRLDKRALLHESQLQAGAQPLQRLAHRHAAVQAQWVSGGRMR